MNEPSRISVIIPVYGRTNLLEQCLASFAASELQPFEIIIVDDGNVASVSDEIVKTARGHHLIRLPKNSGAPAARNAGARAANGEMLFFADADICINPTALAALLHALRENPRAAFAYGDFDYGSIHMLGKSFSAEQLRRQNYISTMSLVRTEHFPGFDEDLTRFQDWDLWLTIAERGGLGSYVPQTIFKAAPGGSISTWIPSLVVKYAQFFMWIPRVREYMQAREIILKKHSR